MLYSKFGSRLIPISKSQDAQGRTIVQATAEGTTDVREYQISDLKADEGSAEINAVLEKLPAKVIENIPSARKRIADLPQNNRKENNRQQNSRQQSNRQQNDRQQQHRFRRR